MKHIYYDPEHWATINLMEWSGDFPGWCITGVEVNYFYRGNGYASALLDEVLADADSEGVTLYLEIVPDGTGLSFEQLAAFYERKGFVQEPGLSDSGYMRKPKGEASEQGNRHSLASA